MTKKNLALIFLYRIITIIDSARRRPLAYVCLNRVMAVYGGTQGTLPDETGANPRYLRNRMVQRFAVALRTRQGHGLAASLGPGEVIPFTVLNLS